MNKELDYEKIRHIIEKIEKGESLDKNEEIYSDIIKRIIEKKGSKVKIDDDFKNSLKNELLAEYSRIYENKRILNSFFNNWNFSFLRYAVSFCLVFTLSFTFYNGVLKNAPLSNFSGNHINTEVFKDKTSDRAASPSSLKMEEDIGSSKKEVSPINDSVNSSYNNSNGISFGNDKVSNDLKGSSETADEALYPLFAILMISILVSVIFSFKRRKIKDKS